MIVSLLVVGVVGVLYWKFVVAGSASSSSSAIDKSSIAGITQARNTDVELRMSDGAGISNPMRATDESYQYD